MCDSCSVTATSRIPRAPSPSVPAWNASTRRSAITLAKDTPHTIKAGDDGARTLAISSPARFAELISRTGTPAHLDTTETAWDMGLFQAVTEEFGDIILGLPGATPAGLQRNDRCRDRSPDRPRPTHNSP